MVFALPEEAKGLMRVLGNPQMLAKKGSTRNTWFVGNVEIMLGISGIGQERCEAAVAGLLERGAHWIICAGFAAGLGEQQVGDVVIAERVILAGSTVAPSIPCSEVLAEAVPPTDSLGYAIHRGRIATTDAIVTLAEEKDEVGRETGAVALDMESYAAARFCADRGVPFAAIRSISDTVGQDLPAELPALASGSRFGSAMLAVSHPHLWKPLLRLRSQSRVAADNLGDILGIMLLRLM